MLNRLLSGYMYMVFMRLIDFVYTWVPLLEICEMLGLQAFLIRVTQPTLATSVTYLSQWS